MGMIMPRHNRVGLEFHNGIIICSPAAVRISTPDERFRLPWSATGTKYFDITSLFLKFEIRVERTSRGP